MAKLIRNNELNQVARRRYVKAVLRTTCILGVVSASLSVSGQDLLAPPALPSMEALPALPSCQSELQSVDSRCGVPLVLRATRLLGLKKVPQIEWAAIDSQLPKPSTQDIQLPTVSIDSTPDIGSPSVSLNKDTSTDNPIEVTEVTDDSTDSLLAVDLVSVTPEPTQGVDEADSLISVVSMTSLESQAAIQTADEQRSESLLNIEVASETAEQPIQATRSSEIVKRGPTMQLRVGPALPSVRITDVEDTVDVGESDLKQVAVASNTTPEQLQVTSKSPELARPANPKMVINAGATENNHLESTNVAENTVDQSKEHKLAEEKVQQNPGPKPGLVEPALPAQFSLNDKDADEPSSLESRETESPLSRALAMSIENMTKSKELVPSEKLNQKEVKTEAAKSPPTIQSVSAQVEMKPEPPTLRITTPPTIGPQLEVDAGESQAILLQSPVINISVEHPDFCQVVKNGEKSLSVIGIKPGKTRIAIFSSQNSVEIREVIVAGQEDQHSAIERMAKEMSRAVEKMYRSSSVEVVADEEGLVVQGFAESENDAKKIIRMIRQSSLMPVVDRLSTYK